MEAKADLWSSTGLSYLTGGDILSFASDTIEGFS